MLAVDFPDVMNGDDVGVAQLGDGVRFPLQAGEKTQGAKPL